MTMQFRKNNTAVWTGSTIAGLLTLASLPYLVGWWSTPTNQTYLGRNPISPADTMAYISSTVQSADGAVLVENAFTAEPQEPRLFFPLWIVLGWVQGIIQLPTTFLFHIGRIVGGAVLLLVIIRVLRDLGFSLRRRIAILLVIGLSSGLGWATEPSAQSRSFDLWVPESNTFLTLMHSPLFPLTQALLLWLIWTGWKAFEEKRLFEWKWGVGAATLFLLHPYDILTLGLVMLACTLTYRRSLTPGFFARAFLLVLMCIPVGLYFFWSTQEPAISGWAVQNVNQSHSLTQILFGFGLLWPLAIIGVRMARQRKQRWWILLAIWVTASFVLSYFPGLPIQRRLLSGMHIPLALLAGYWLVEAWTKYRTAVKRELLLILTILLPLTTIAMTTRSVKELITPTSATYPSYVTPDEKEVYKYIDTSILQSEGIWTNVWTGNTIAGLIGHRVALGHGHQTVDIHKKISWWDELRARQTSTARRNDIIQASHSPWMVWEQKKDAVGYDPLLDENWEVIVSKPNIHLLRWRD